LDELYYPFLLFPWVYVALRRKRLFLAGFLLAAIMLFRLSYVFMVLGCLFWYAFDRRPSVRDVLQLGGGALIAAAFIVAPFVIIGGHEFFQYNAFTTAYSYSGFTDWPETNIIFQGLNTMSASVGPVGIRLVRLGLFCSLLFALTWRLRSSTIPHPFWHITASSFLAHIIIWFPSLWPLDYSLIFVLPAFLALAFTPAVPLGQSTRAEGDSMAPLPQTPTPRRW
jgi:hypothetical protein